MVRKTGKKPGVLSSYVPPHYLYDLMCGRAGVYLEEKARLNREGVERLIGWFQEQGMDVKDASVFSEALASRHRHHLFSFGQGPRNAEIIKELKCLRDASVKFKDALDGLSTAVRERLVHGLFIKKSDDPGVLLPGQIDVSRAANLFMHPAAMAAIQLIINVSGDVITNTPKDRGGKRSGACDVDGTEAKRILIVELLHLLDELGLPSSTAEGGPLSKCFELVHSAAGGGLSEGLADDYAEMALRLNSEIPLT